MKILVLNCGSSSIKYQLLEMNNEANLLAKGIVERIGQENAILTHKRPGAEKFTITKPILTHTYGIKLLLKALTCDIHGVIEKYEDIEAVGHRVAHGGEYFEKSTIIDKQARGYIEKCCKLAPLHNPANLKGIDAMTDLLPKVPQVAVFDTSFHHSMPAYSFHYPLPYEYYEKHKIRRYGFHGTSHKFVAEKACGILDWDISKKKIISCHLGNGASICAIDGGKSLDTSMGFTPVEGLMMGTRVGDLDLGALLHIMDVENLDVEEAKTLINKKSGVEGFSGVSSDMRDLEDAIEKGNKRAELTLKMYAYRVKKYIGAYVAAMNGLDLIILTGGIGENSDYVRESVFSEFDYLGVEFNYEVNKGLKGTDIELSMPNSKTKVWIITTDEELVIAKDTQRLITE